MENSVDVDNLASLVEEIFKRKVKRSLKIEVPKKEDRCPDGIEDIRISISLYEDVYVVRRMPDGEYSIHEGEIDE